MTISEPRMMVHQLEDCLVGWVGGRVKFQTNIFRPTAYSIESAMCRSNVGRAELETLGKLGILIFSLDDVFDNSKLRVDDMANLNQVIILFIRGQLSREEAGEKIYCFGAGKIGVILDMIEEIKRALFKYDLFLCFESQWEKYWQRYFEGVLKVRMMKDSKDVSLRRYLAWAKYTTGLPLMCLTAIILIGDFSVISAWQQFEEYIEESGMIMRMVNDIRPHQEEIDLAELSVLNFMPAERIGRLIRQKYEKILVAGKYIETETKIPERVLKGFLEVGLELYRRVNLRQVKV